MDLLMLLGVAACFSAHEDGDRGLPFDPRTGVLRPEVWQRWLDWDPVRMVPRYAGRRSRSLRAIWIDAGTSGRVLPRPGRGGVPRRRCARSACTDDVIRFELFDGDARRHRLPVPAVAGLALPADRAPDIHLKAIELIRRGPT